MHETEKRGLWILCHDERIDPAVDAAADREDIEAVGAGSGSCRDGEVADDGGRVRAADHAVDGIPGRP